MLSAPLSKSNQVERVLSRDGKVPSSIPYKRKGYLHKKMLKSKITLRETQIQERIVQLKSEMQRNKQAMMFEMPINHLLTNKSKGFKLIL